MKNARVLAQELKKYGFRIVSGGTDNHLMLVDLTDKKITGKDLEKLLDTVHITVNKNAIPFDKLSPNVTSGIRLGTPAVTTRGFKEEEMKEIAYFINLVVDNRDEDLGGIREKVIELCHKFPLYK